MAYLPNDGAAICRQRKAPQILCQKTGNRFRASYPHDWTAGDAMAATFSGKTSFHFRRMVKVTRRWLCNYWEDTGEIWQPKSGEFDVSPRRPRTQRGRGADGEAGSSGS